MKITKERKIYASVCGLAAILFAADQLFSSKQAGAAETSVAMPVAAQVATAAPAAPASAATQGNFVASRLRDIAKSENLSLDSLVDAFRGASASAGETSIAGGSFKSTHALGAVMVSGRGGSAIINGKCVRIGETIDGYQLESVAKGIATLTSGDGRVELTIEDKTPESPIADANK